MRRGAPHPALRAVAVGCVVLWLAATSYCSLDELLESTADSYGHCFQAEPGASHSPQDSAHRRLDQDAGLASGGNRDNGGQHSRPGHDQDGVCCSHLHATAQMPQAALDESVFDTTDTRCVRVVPGDLAISPSSGNESGWRAKTLDWVFRPEVCLGPAVRSHAPPSSPVT